MIIKMMFFNNPLDPPGRNRLIILAFVDNFQFLFAIAEILAPQAENAEFLISGDLPMSGSFGSPALFFQGFQMIRLVPFLPEIEGFSGNAEISTGLGRILAFPVVIKPLQSFPGFRRKARQSG